MVTIGYELGSRVFSSVRVWASAIAMTFGLCEGAGFGAFSYHCLWYNPFAATGPQCTLAGQALFPPAVTWSTFAWNAGTLWLAGFLDGGFVLGLFIAAFALGVASRMSSAAVTRAFSFLPVALACVLLCALAYNYEVQATFAAGLPRASF